MVILSPHLDDAALSCWHLLAGPGEVTVVNVFDGSPPSGTPLPWWDTLTGARDPVSRMRERHAEDEAVRAVLGRRAIGLGLLDAQYRRADLEPGALVGRLAERIEEGTLIYAPAAIDNDHLDHAAVRDAAIELARSGRRLCLYADIPQAIRRGWPAWVTGKPEAQGVSTAWLRTLTGAGLVVERLIPRVHPLDAGARERKLRTLAQYETQRAALDSLAFAPLDDPRALAYEVTWEVPAQALPSRDGAHQARREPLVAEGGGKAFGDRA